MKTGFHYTSKMAETKDSTVVAAELVSRPQRIAAPKYRYMKVYPVTGSGEVTIAPTARSVIQFEVPTQSFNYSESYFCGKLETKEPAGGNDFTQWLYKDCASFVDRVNFRTRSGATLIDLDYVANYTKIVNRYETPLDEVQSLDETNLLCASRPFPQYSAALTMSDVKDMSDNKTSVVSDVKVVAGPGSYRPSGSILSHPYIEAKYCDSGKIKTAAVSGKHEWSFRIPLSKLVPNSVFSRRSDLKLPEIATLTMALGPGTKISWEGKSLANPADNAAACSTNTVFSSLYLHLAKQDDTVYEAMMDQRMLSGYSIPINYPIQTRTDFTGTSAREIQNVSVTYNAGYGNRIVKIYHAPFNATDSKNIAFDNECHADLKKVDSYHVKIGGLRTTEDELSTKPSDPSAYLYHKSLLEGTSITNADIYHANFAHVEDIARIGGPKRWRELSFRKDDAEVGVPLTQDFKFEFISKMADDGGGNYPALQHYTYAIVQRTLKVNAVTAVVE